MNIKSRIIAYVFILISVFSIFTIGCKKPKEAPLPVAQNADTSNFTDTVNKNVYKIVKIGNQWWMAENLKATKYRNGQYISQISDRPADTIRWKNDTMGAACFYGNNNNAPGLLYNWYAVNNPNQLAPAGWHVATDDEWKTLEEYVGMSVSDANGTNWRGTDEANKLKIYYSITYWSDPHNKKIFSTNESGFTALAGDCRLFNAKWGDEGLKSAGYWWTATTGDSGNKAWYRYMAYKSSQVFRNVVSKNYGFSVRCVKD